MEPSNYRKALGVTNCADTGFSKSCQDGFFSCRETATSKLKLRNKKKSFESVNALKSNKSEFSSNGDNLNANSGMSKPIFLNYDQHSIQAKDVVISSLKLNSVHSPKKLVSQASSIFSMDNISKTKLKDEVKSKYGCQRCISLSTLVSKLNIDIEIKMKEINELSKINSGLEIKLQQLLCLLSKDNHKNSRRYFELMIEHATSAFTLVGQALHKRPAYNSGMFHNDISGTQKDYGSSNRDSSINPKSNPKTQFSDSRNWGKKQQNNKLSTTIVVQEYSEHGQPAINSLYSSPKDNMMKAEVMKQQCLINMLEKNNSKQASLQREMQYFNYGSTSNHSKNRSQISDFCIKSSSKQEESFDDPIGEFEISEYFKVTTLK